MPVHFRFQLPARLIGRLSLHSACQLGHHLHRRYGAGVKAHAAEMVTGGFLFALYCCESTKDVAPFSSARQKRPRAFAIRGWSLFVLWGLMRQNNAIVMLGMLQIIFRHHAVPADIASRASA